MYSVQIRSIYDNRGLLIRLAVDLLLSNVGMFFGVLVTVFIWSTSWAVSREELFDAIFFTLWLPNIPAFNAACLIGFLFFGLYKIPRDGVYRRQVKAVVKAVVKSVSVALFLHLMMMFIFGIKSSRSTLLAGWVFTFSLILFSRLFRVYFFRMYRLVSVAAESGETEKLARELELLTQQDGWMPPEGMPRNASWPYFEDDEVIAAAAVLRSGKINQWTGKEVDQFQREFAAFCGVRHTIALANGSVALDLAINVLNIGPGDEVIVTPRTFVASASCLALRGAKPVFADVDPDSQNITAASIEKVLTSRTRAIIAVHLAGCPCDMDPILELAEEHHLKVIEDCAQCHGAVYYSRKPGREPAVGVGQDVRVRRDGVRLYPRMTGSLGHMAAFSFCQDKIMTTGGEGGMLLTDNDNLWKKAWAFKDHGKSYDAVYNLEHEPGFRWLHQSFGTNLRMTAIQAAIGRQQLKKLPAWVATRRRNAEVLTKAFSSIPAFRLPQTPNNVTHSYYKYYVFVRQELLKSGWSRDRIMNAVAAEGSPCFSGSCSEVYLEKAFDREGFRPVKRLPVAKELGETSLMFLVHPTLTEKDMEAVASAVLKVMAEAGRKK